MDNVVASTLAADRLVSIGKLSGSLGHELNNLLTGILVFAETMSRSMVGTAQHEDSLEILTAARRATDLLKGFVQFSQGAARSASIPTLVESLRLLLHYRAHLSAMRLEVELPEGSAPELLGGAVDFQHLLVNLVLRAIEGGVPGQTVVLRLVVLAPGQLALTVHRRGDAEGGRGRSWLPGVEQDLAVAQALASRLGGQLELGSDGKLLATLPIAGEA